MPCLFLMIAASAGLFTFLRRRSVHGPSAWAPSFRAWGGWRGRHPERVAEWLSHHLDTSVEQKRVIRDEVEGLGEVMHELRREVRLSGGDIATALRTEHFDEERMGDSFARQDDRIRSVRTALVGALARIHDVLDERQRRRFASLLESRF